MSSGVTLDTLQDKQMLDDFVEAKRGGICGIMEDRIVNNGETGMKSHNKNIWYIDANNLYGHAMMQKLPYKDFQFTTTSTLDTVINTPDDSDHGYYIVCGINYTDTCKDRTEQIALMPDKRKINDNELGYREREKGKTKTEKLISDQNKTEYMVHYRMLKFYIKMRVKLTKIHRVVKFKQDYICRDYIPKQYKKRATAKSEAEKDVRKLMNNSLYGRMCMNPLHFLQSKFLHDEEKIKKSISKPSFKTITRYKAYSQIENIKK